MSFRRMIASLQALTRKRPMDRELDDEILAHLELAERDFLERGLSPEEARRAARRRFGGIEQMKEEHRSKRSLQQVEMFLKDFRYGLGSLPRAPGFSGVIVGVLAIGIGATVAMFSVVDAVFVKPLPFQDPERIVQVWEAPRPGITNSTTARQFLDWKHETNIFETLAAEQSISVALTGSGEPTRISGKAVSADYFKIFTASTALGRTFAPDEDHPGAEPVIVLSHAAWQKYFGAAADILSRHLILNGRPYQVIGVLKAGAFDRDETQFWQPLIFTPSQLSSESHWFTVSGRLKSGATLTQARERMRALYNASLANAPLDEREGTIVVEPLTRLLVGANLHRTIWVAFGAVLLVLLIACANAANLLFAQGATRGTELAVRAALGASRGRLVVQLFTESYALCLLGGAAGVAVAYALIHLATPLLSESLPFTADVTLDLRVLGFALAVALGVTVLAGTLPALQVPIGNLECSLKQSSRGASSPHARMRRIIIGGEVALSFVLVCSALLLARSLQKLQALDTGVRVENVISMSTDLPVGAYGTAQKAAFFYYTVAQRLQSAPGVMRAGMATSLPLEWVSNGEAIQVAGAGKLVRVRLKRVDPGYTGALGIPVLKGRGVRGGDRDGSPRVIVINQALAGQLAELAGMKDPIGKTVRLSSTGYVDQKPILQEVQIVGVIRSERTNSPGYPDPPVAYVPLAQAPSAALKIVVRTHATPSSVMPAIREAIHAVDPNLPLGDVQTMEQVRNRALSGASRPAGLIGAFALIAILLAATGLYGVVSHSVTQRRREIGIRIALGAPLKNVLSHVLRNALSMVLAGLAFGLIGAFAVTRAMKSLLFEVSPLDPIALAAACLSMMLIGLMASYLPANRATRVDPATTLRDTG